MSGGGCPIGHCHRAPAIGQVLCGWHASQTPTPLLAELMTASRTRTRAVWGLGLFRNATDCSRRAAKQALDDALAAVRTWWAGGAR